MTSTPSRWLADTVLLTHEDCGPLGEPGRGRGQRRPDPGHGGTSRRAGATTRGAPSGSPPHPRGHRHAWFSSSDAATALTAVERPVRPRIASGRLTSQVGWVAAGSRSVRSGSRRVETPDVGA